MLSGVGDNYVKKRDRQREQYAYIRAIRRTLLPVRVGRCQDTGAKR